MLSSAKLNSTDQICPTWCTYHLCKSNEGFFDQVLPFRCLKIPFQICQPWLSIRYGPEYPFGVICSNTWQYGIHSDIVLYFQVVLLTSICTLLLAFFNTGDGTFYVMIWNFLFRGMNGWRGSQFVTICADRAIFQGTWKVTGSKKVTNCCRKINLAPKCILYTCCCSWCTSHWPQEVSVVESFTLFFENNRQWTIDKIPHVICSISANLVHMSWNIRTKGSIRDIAAACNLKLSSLSVMVLDMPCHC